MTKRPLKASTRPQVRRDAAVQLILTAALEELSVSGFGAMSVDSVAERAKVNKTTIYRRWPTKRELVMDALAARGSVALPLPDTGRLGTDLLQILGQGAHFMSSPVGSGVVRARLAEGHDPGFAQVFSGPGRYERKVKRVLDRAVQRNELPADTDSEMLVAMLVGALVFRRFIEQRRITSRFVEKLIQRAVAR